MSYYNHFSQNKYASINFNELKIGDKFRMDKHENGRRRRDIIMIKTGKMSYREMKSKKEYTLFSSNLEVGDYEKLNNLNQK